MFLSKHLTSIYLYSKKSLFSSFPVDSAILLLVSRYPYRWMYEGHSKGRTVIKATYGDALAILFKGRDHLPKGNTIGSSRDYDLLIYGSLLKRSRFKGHECFSGGNQSRVP